MSKKLVSDLIVDYLERRGVTELFGLCGHTVIGMLDALSRSKKLRYIGTRHEAIASTAADGYRISLWILAIAMVLYLTFTHRWFMAHKVR